MIPTNPFLHDVGGHHIVRLGVKFVHANGIDPWDGFTATTTNSRHICLATIKVVKSKQHKKKKKQPFPDEWMVFGAETDLVT